MTLSIHQLYSTIFLIPFFMTTQSCWAQKDDVDTPTTTLSSTGPSDTTVPDPEIQILEGLIGKHRTFVVHDDFLKQLQPTSSQPVAELMHTLRDENTQAEDKVDLLIEVGKHRLEAEQLGWAIQKFQEALDLIPQAKEAAPEQRWDILLALGATKAQQTVTDHHTPNPDEAVAAFESIPRGANKHHWHGQYQKVRLLQQVQGTFTEPQHNLPELYASFPQEAGLYYGQAQYRLGGILYGQKEYRNAAEAYLKAVSVPTLPVKMRRAALVQLARSYALTGNFHGAEQNFRDALPLLGGDIQIQLEYLAVQRRLGFYVSVEDALKTLLGLENTNATEGSVSSQNIETTKFLLGLIHCDILERSDESSPSSLPMNIPYLRDTLMLNWMSSSDEGSNRIRMLTSIENALKQKREKRKLSTLDGSSREEGEPAGLSSQDKWYLVSDKAESDPLAPTELTRALANSTRTLTGVYQEGAGVVVRVCKSTGDLLDSATIGLGRHVINPLLGLVDNDA